MEQDFTYYAFISYSHKDEVFAKKLQHYLEHYKLPSVLCRKYPHIPKTLRPIFRDGSDLAVGQLNEALQEALTNSRYLIVICSENSVKPNDEGKNWIDEEIRMFLSLHGQEYGLKHIIPVILRQEGGLKSKECMLPTIREFDILGIDVLKHGEERTYNDVIAKMVKLNPDTLWGRYQRSLRRQRRIRRIAGGLAAALAAVVGWGYWYYNAEHVSYYTDYVERNNIPEGLIELTEEQVKTRQRHYRFTEHKLRVRKVEYCNSVGTPQEHDSFWNLERPARMEFEYNEKGNAILRRHRNAQGKELTVCEFKDNIIDFTQQVAAGGGQGNVAQSAILATSLRTGYFGIEKSSISRFFVQREKEGANEGMVRREIFCKASSLTPAKDVQGVGGREYKRDELGRPVEVRYLAVLFEADGNQKVEPIETKQGIAGYRLQYGDNGLVSAISYFNKKGHPVLNEELWAERRFRYDERGNIMVDFCYDTNLKLCTQIYGYTYRMYKTDEQGNILEVAYYDANRWPCLTQYGYARVAMRYDERGNCIDMAHFSEHDKPCTIQGGYARSTARFDEQGNCVEMAYFCEHDKPCLIQGGYARSTARFDEQGNCVEMAFFGVDNEPCIAEGGYARSTARFDEQGNCVEISFFGIDKKPCVTKNGCARSTARFDERGNQVEEAYFDADGKPCIIQGGYARVEAQYDERGNCLEYWFSGVDGERCLSQDGFARAKARFDERGNLAEVAYFGVDETPCITKNGYARTKASYDKRGYRVEEACFGVDGKPCASSEGYARMTWRYNNRGNCVEAAYFDVDGKPFLLKEGFTRVTWDYDERGNCINTTYHDARDATSPLFNTIWDTIKKGI